MIWSLYQTSAWWQSVHKMCCYHQTSTSQTNKLHTCNDITWSTGAYNMLVREKCFYHKSWPCSQVLIPKVTLSLLCYQDGSSLQMGVGVGSGRRRNKIEINPSCQWHLPLSFPFAGKLYAKDAGEETELNEYFHIIPMKSLNWIHWFHVCWDDQFLHFGEIFLKHS